MTDSAESKISWSRGATTWVHSGFHCVTLGALAGALIGFFDVALFLGQTPSELSANQCSRAIGISLVSGLAWGTLIALFFGGPASWLRDKWEVRTLNIVSGSLLILSLLTVYVDATQYVNLYPELHRMLGGIAFVLGVVGSLIRPIRIHRSINLLILVLAVLSPFGIRLLLQGHNALAQILMEQTTLTGRTTGLLWTPAERDVSEDCEWPSPTRPKISSLPTGASVLVLTIDAWRADLAEHHLDHVMPNLARRAQTGAYFKRAYAASTRTHESIYSLMTGQWPHRLTFTPAGWIRMIDFEKLTTATASSKSNYCPCMTRVPLWPRPCLRRDTRLPPLSPMCFS